MPNKRRRLHNYIIEHEIVVPERAERRLWSQSRSPAQACCTIVPYAYALRLRTCAMVGSSYAVVPAARVPAARPEHPHTIA